MNSAAYHQGYHLAINDTLLEAAPKPESISDFITGFKDGYNHLEGAEEWPALLRKRIGESVSPIRRKIRINEVGSQFYINLLIHSDGRVTRAGKLINLKPVLLDRRLHCIGPHALYHRKISP